MRPTHRCRGAGYRPLGLAEGLGRGVVPGEFGEVLLIWKIAQMSTRTVPIAMRRART
jgi:hypothetical protein